MNEEDKNFDQIEEELGEEEDPPNYGDVTYWDSRYQILEDFDWYQTWNDLLSAFAPFFTGDELVLNIGCGNSRMSFEMAETTFKKVISIDFSNVVIDQMKKVYSDNKKLEWHVMDCTALTFKSETFDVVFDKGTTDSILCGDSPMYSVYKTLSEVSRVLKSSGLFFMISYAKPESRLYIFENCKLHWHLHKPMILPNPQKPNCFHYVYIFQKLNPEIDLDIYEKEVEYDYEEEEEEEEDTSLKGN